MTLITLDCAASQAHRTNGSKALRVAQDAQTSIIEHLNEHRNNIWREKHQIERDTCELSKIDSTQYERLHSHFERKEQAVVSEDAHITDLLSLQSPRTIRECCILLQVADHHLDMLLCGSVELESEAARDVRGAKLDSIRRNVLRTLMRLHGITGEALGFTGTGFDPIVDDDQEPFEGSQHGTTH